MKTTICVLLGCLALAACGTHTAGDPQESKSSLTAGQANLARWSSVINLPMVPVAAANLPDGKVLFWAAEDRFGFSADTGMTYTATFDPKTLTSTERLVSETGHDMFCPGTANLADGRVLVNGGLSAGTTSIYDGTTGVWAKAGTMNIPRAYEGTTPLFDGSVFTLGGSWNGGVGNKHGEIWDPVNGWQRLPGVPIDPFLSTDNTRNFGMDSHLWLLTAGNGRIFHAGPGINMNWVDTTGGGSVIPIGPRGDDAFSINGNAVMYDVGKVLKVGGAPGYDGLPASASAYVMDVGTSVVVRKIQPMAYPRGFSNSVVLPNGQVVVIGGATVATGFTDDNAVLAPEIFDPTTETFTALPPMSVARNYHSVALLLPDGRVMSGGGGLCGAGCSANHADLQILSPPYLFNADGTPAARPSILSAPASANHGTTVSITTDSPVASFVAMRSSSTTHALNNDQRRIPLTSRATGTNQYNVDIPTNPGWAVPGLYMLFALNANGVPSNATIVRIGSPKLMRLAMGDQQSAVGAPASLQLVTSNPNNATLTYGASGLPPGLTLNVATGVVSGTPTQQGRYVVDANASDGTQKVSTQFVYTIGPSGGTRYVMLQADSEVNGNPWTSAAEINLIGTDGQNLPRTAWTATADSMETSGENGNVLNAIDGNPGTLWHTQWAGASPPPPHWIRIDLGGFNNVVGLRYLPRQDSYVNGTIAKFRISLSADGTFSSPPVATGDFTALGPVQSEKTIYFTDVALGKNATQSSTSAGGVAARAVDGNTDGVFANGSVTSTNSEASPWWEVDLGSTYTLYGARVWNRTDCCGSALANFYVLASATPMQGRSLAELLADSAVSKVQTPGPVTTSFLVTLSATGRFVRVQLANTNALSLAEVQVFGTLVPGEHPPTLATPAPADASVGAQVSLALIGSDPDGDTLTYSAAGLPPGLTLDPSTGIISGIPTTSGSYAIDASVDDAKGGTATVHFNWFIGIPVPVVNPVVSPLAAASGALTYTASATGTGLQYQWNFGDGTGDSGFSTTPTITHTFVSPGVYLGTLTVRNTDGAAGSTQFVQAIAAPSIAGTPVSSSNIAIERRSGQTARLWVVNIDNDTVSVFDTAANTKLAEIPVGSMPRSVTVAPDGSVWVANKGAATLSVVDPSSLTVTRTVSLPRASQPFGVVAGPDGNVFVTLEALGQVLKLDGTGNTLASVDVGPSPRHLALTQGGALLLVSRFITPPQPGESTATVQTTVGGIPVGGEVLVLDPASLTLSRTIELQHSSHPDTEVSGRGVPNYLGAPAISPDGLSAWVPSKQDNIQRGKLRDQQDLNFQNTVRAISSRINLSTQAEDYAARIDHDNSSLASAALYHPSGVYLFVALETSRQVAVLDAYGKRELFRVDAGRAPQGLALSPDGRTIYVHNALDRTVGAYDLGPLVDRGQEILPLVGTLSSVAVEKLSAQVLRGKQLFYDARDPRLSRDSYMSCASCHNDGGNDGRTWDLTGFGEGLRNTILLRGHAVAQGRLHWSANFDEVQDFEGQIRTLNQGTGLMTDAAFNTGTRSQPLGDPKAGISPDLDALASYVGSLTTFAQSPYRMPSGALTDAAASGRVVFGTQCLPCHGGTSFTDSDSLVLHDVGTIKPSSGSRLGGPLTGIDAPTLRDVWATAPYLHDGSAPSVMAAIQAHTNLTLNPIDLANVTAFTLQIGSEEGTVLAPAPSGSVRYVMLEADSEWNGNAWTSAAEINLIGADGSTLSRTGWTATADSMEMDAENGSVLNALDGNAATIWHTQWSSASPTPPHWIKIDMGTFNKVIGLRYLPRQDSYVNGSIAKYRIFLSTDGTTWGTPIATGDFKSFGTAQLEKVVYFNDFTVGNSGSPFTIDTSAATGLLGQYFPNTNLSGAPALTRTEAVNFSWATGSPDPAIPADGFSARWTGQFAAPTSGSYTFQTINDDGVRLYVNGALIINNWVDHTTSTTNNSSAVTLVAGQRYDIILEYYEKASSAVMKLNWKTPGSTTYVAVPATQLYTSRQGLFGQYFSNNALTGSPLLTRYEPVNFSWGTTAPATGIPTSNYSVRWNGRVGVVADGKYIFQTTSAEGIRLWVNGILVIDNWTSHASATNAAEVTLQGGLSYDIKIEYYKQTKSSVAKLAWIVPGATTAVPVPQNQLIYAN